MPQANTKKQEPRDQNVGVAVTESERRAVKAVAAALGISESELIRGRTMDEILEQYEKVKAAVA